jgi:hypothetical protein|tara:strand:+ start:640 stop:858 length:219 start_codon:yes stop_codon:yes gene_type:complete
MDFVKDLLQIQHLKTIHQVSKKLLTDDFEIDQFIQKYDKKNYCMVKQCNCKMNGSVYGNCVKIEDLLSTLTL